MRGIKIILLATLFLRLLVAPLGEHGDVVQYYWWTKDLVARDFSGFYEREIINAMRPTYPPVTSYLFWLAGEFHELIYRLSWIFNNIPTFPSNFILWMESEKGWYFFNKLPAIFADLGIIFVLYKFTGLTSAAIFALAVPFWYNSAVWGQTDSIYGLFVISAFFALYKKRLILAPLLYTLAILTKPTAVFALPIFIIWWLRQVNLKTFTLSVFLMFTTTVALYWPFHQQNIFSWLITFYSRSLSGELSYIVANSFNFWGFIFGFGNMPDYAPFLGIPAAVFGFLIFLTFLTIFILIFIKSKMSLKSVLGFGVLCSFAAFLFLPRMHERYFYITLLLFTAYIGKDIRLLHVYIIVSAIHLLNLYHFWWFPKFDLLVNVLSNRTVEQTLIVVNIGIFFYLMTIWTGKKFDER